ncbi:hypothetical protein GCM10010401_01620 [Rarobacter faecitabidus]|uniref:SCP domain-containing protein n=1 Tax=Rarobacter faecitabidus TaxID=13243 RepID=A0A542ZWF8_RARFA|nr:hypothetical protein FB461_1212 [Rarobacter faecitabidus]
MAALVTAALAVPALCSAAYADDPVPLKTAVKLKLIDENRWPVRGIDVTATDGNLLVEDATSSSNGAVNLVFDYAETRDVTLTLVDGYGESADSWRTLTLQALHPGETRDLGTITYRVQAKPGKASTAINTSSKAAVAKAYRSQYKKQLRNEKPVKVKGCKVGKTPAALQKRVLTSVNFVRSLAGVEKVTLDKKISARASKAALIQYKQGWLEHFPSKKAKCWSSVGADESGKSNLSGGTIGAANVRAYMDDAGGNNLDAGHRGWLLTPTLSKIGVGYAGDFGALHVVNYGDGQRVDSVKQPLWTSWPTAGYFPKQLEPQGRWSFNTSRGDISFAKAKVKVQVGKKTVKQKVVSRGDGIVFDLAKTPYSTAKKYKNKVASVKVTISGMRLRDATTLPPYTYTVKFFTP